MLPVSAHGRRIAGFFPDARNQPAAASCDRVASLRGFAASDPKRTFAAFAEMSGSGGKPPVCLGMVFGNPDVRPRSEHAYTVPDEEDLTSIILLSSALLVNFPRNPV